MYTFQASAYGALRASVQEGCGLAKPQRIAKLILRAFIDQKSFAFLGVLAREFIGCGFLFEEEKFRLGKSAQAKIEGGAEAVPILSEAIFTKALGKDVAEQKNPPGKK